MVKNCMISGQNQLSGIHSSIFSPQYRGPMCLLELLHSVLSQKVSSSAMLVIVFSKMTGIGISLLQFAMLQ